MELTFRTAGIGDLELLTESRLRAIRTYRHLSETAALPHGLPDAVRDYYRQALASGSHIATVTIIHGKGTGVLRTAIQKHLKHHPSVKSFRLGTFGEGEAGVTIVELK